MLLLLPFFVLLVSLVCSFVLPVGKPRKIARVTAIVAGSLSLLGLVGCVMMFWLLFGAEPPSLPKLAEKFPARRSDLEAIVRLSNEDAWFSRVALDFVDYNPPKGTTQDGRFMQEDPKEPLPKTRWDQYRVLFKEVDSKLGIQRDGAGNAFVMEDSIGLLNSGHATGYLFCVDQGSPASQNSMFEPCALSHQDSGSRAYSADPRAEAYSFRKVAEHWYVFDQGPS